MRTIVLPVIGPVIGLAALGLSALVQAAPAAPDPAVRGKVVFARCAACHATSSSAPKKQGPHLQGIVGRKSGTVAGFAYSPAMKGANVRFDEATLDRYLTKPSAMVQGTKMVFAGIPDANDRKALIAYLRKTVP